jgi:hypothetical protein
MFFYDKKLLRRAGYDDAFIAAMPKRTLSSYYRSSLGNQRPRQDQDRAPRVPAQRLPGVGPHVPVESGNVIEMVDADAATILTDINEKLTKFGSWPIPIALLGVIAPILLSCGSVFLPVVLLVTAIAGAAAYGLYRRDETRFTTVLMYDLDDAVVGVFERFTAEFDQLSQARKVMNIDTKGIIYDWKRHGGAAFEVNSGPARLGYGTPKRIQTNVSVPYIAGGLNTVYFFPDLLLVFQRKKVGGLDYQNVSIQFHDQRFHEADSVPGDTAVVGSTWRFVRRDGGPDRRVNNNRQIPIVNYQSMVLNGTGDFQKVLYLSRNISRIRFLAAVAALAKLHGDRIRSSGAFPVSGRR